MSALEPTRFCKWPGRGQPLTYLPCISTWKWAALNPRLRRECCTVEPPRRLRFMQPRNPSTEYLTFLLSNLLTCTYLGPEPSKPRAFSQCEGMGPLIYGTSYGLCALGPKGHPPGPRGLVSRSPGRVSAGLHIGGEALYQFWDPVEDMGVSKNQGLNVDPKQ